MGLPKQGDLHGSRVPVVLKRSGQCPIHGEGEQGYGNVRDCAMDVANREGISSQGRLSPRPGEPDVLKGTCPVREGAVGKGPSGDTARKFLVSLRKETAPRWPPTSSASAWRKSFPMRVTRCRSAMRPPASRRASPAILILNHAAAQSLPSIVPKRWRPGWSNIRKTFQMSRT